MIQKRQPTLCQQRHCDQPRRAVWLGAHKLIQTGSEYLELYRVVDDPFEEHDLSRSAPTEVQQLRRHLTNLQQAQGVAPNAEQIEDASDPALTRRLRDLGYIE